MDPQSKTDAVLEYKTMFCSHHHVDLVMCVDDALASTSDINMRHRTDVDTSRVCHVDARYFIFPRAFLLEGEAGGDGERDVYKQCLREGYK